MAIDESKYKKTVSNYVIQEKHQSTDKGDIFERDITTIGGRNLFDRNQRIVYESGNFIITSSNDKYDPKPSQNWEDVYEEEYKWDDVKDVSEEEDSSIGLEVKPDVHDLRNFAYYGSCVELIRASLNHIISEFPGEVYATDQQVTYYDKETNKFEILGKDKGTLYLIDNPFGLSLHEEYVDKDLVAENPLKYLHYLIEDKYPTEKQYEFVDIDGKHYTFTIEFNDACAGDDCCVQPYDYIGKGILFKTELNSEDNSYQKLENEWLQFFWVYKGEGKDFIYLTNKSGWHIRPQESYYNSFKNRLSLFERTLLTEDSTPKYSPSFDVYKENEWGFEVKLTKFTFPLGDGGYNLGITKPAYLVYVNKLTKIAELYDEYFSDNLYRVMTHEAIKNFDWSYKREYVDNEEQEHIEGGGRIQKFIRLIGREFDEIKLYIDNIANANTVTYNGSDNTPDYFLTDQVELEGWDYNHIIPSNEGGKFIPYNDILMPFDGEKDSEDEVLPIASLEYTSSDINNLFSRILKLNSRAIWNRKGTIACIESLLGLFGFKSKRWVNAFNKNTYIPKIVTDCEKPKDEDRVTDRGKIGETEYDYDVIESVSVVENYITVNGEAEKINNINALKNIHFDEDSRLIFKPTRWRGLMVKEKEIDSDGNTALFPYFSKDKQYDGNPYYQMDGGWLYREKSLDDDYNLIEVSYTTETLSTLKGVNDIGELMSLPTNRLKDGDCCYVRHLDIDYLIVDGYPYELKDYIDSDEVKNKENLEDLRGLWYYFEKQVVNGSIIVGDKIYSNSIFFVKPYIDGENFVTENVVKPISDYPNNTIIRIYVKKGDNGFDFSDSNGTIPSHYTLISRLKEEEDEDAKHYFILNDAAFCSQITLDNEATPMTTAENNTENNENSNCTRCESVLKLGWNQLNANSNEYKRLKHTSNYYEGNNPHTASRVSDLGFDYIDHFAHLFKYSLENELFNWDKVYNLNSANNSKKRSEIRESIRDFGFKGLIADKSCSEYNIADCTKIHNTKLNELGDYLISHEDFANTKHLIPKEGTGETITQGEGVDSDLIINTKVVEIQFKYEENTDWRIKYIDKVIMPYLTQILPSSLIIKISYKEESNGSSIRNN